MVRIQTLGPDRRPLSALPPYLIKFLPEVASQLQESARKGLKAVLVVSNGEYVIKCAGKEYSCPATIESSKISIYKDNTFQGFIKKRLKVDHATSPVTTSSTTTSSISKPNHMMGKQELVDFSTHSHSTSPFSPSSLEPYAVEEEDPLKRFLHFLALGPTTKRIISKRLQLLDKQIDNYLAQYLQPYDAKNSFNKADVYPNNGPEQPSDLYTLKDKSYKETRPALWKYYSDHERSLIIQNINNALTRLGFSETHPLRKKIIGTEDPKPGLGLGLSGPNGDLLKKKTNLGGGLLAHKKDKSPFKSINGGSGSSNSNPIATGSPRKRVANEAFSSNLASSGSSPRVVAADLGGSTSSSDDDKPLNKKRRPESQPLVPRDLHHHPHPNSMHHHKQTTQHKRSHSTNSYKSTPSSSTNVSNINNSSSDNSTSPSSVNEDTYPEEKPPPPVNSEQKKINFYRNLALKFNSKYSEYETLYKGLQAPKGSRNVTNDKKNLTRLLELHKQLAEWKQKLWDYDDQSKRKMAIMGLQKHKKVTKSHSLSPAIAPSQPMVSVEPKLPERPLFQRSMDY